jgi:hypothetical protein
MARKMRFEGLEKGSTQEVLAASEEKYEIFTSI